MSKRMLATGRVVDGVEIVSWVCQDCGRLATLHMFDNLWFCVKCNPTRAQWVEEWNDEAERDLQQTYDDTSRGGW